MLESIGPEEIVAVVSGLVALGTLAIRIGGRVAMAREQRRAMAAIAHAFTAESRSGRAWHQTRSGDQWSVTIGAAESTEAHSRQPPPQLRDGDRRP